MAAAKELGMLVPEELSVVGLMMYHRQDIFWFH